jgi:hypothetical protein
MKQIKLRVVSDNGVEATISTDGSQGGVEDYYSVVSVEGFMKARRSTVSTRCNRLCWASN